MTESNRFYYLSLFLFKASIESAASMNNGKIADTRIPILRSPPAASATNPATVGPVVQPTSPARESSANIEVVQPGILDVASEKVQGQKIPTANPQRIQPRSPIIGELESDIAK